jgi:hypothetical protein
MGFNYVSKGVKWAQKFGWVNYFHCSQKKHCKGAANIRFSNTNVVYVTNPIHNCTNYEIQRQSAVVVDVCEAMKDRAEALAISNLSDRAVVIWKVLREEFYPPGT